MRVALFGGTFDPPHRGHLGIARDAARAFALDTVLFAPAGRQPLKQSQPTASYADRLAMVTLACEEEEEEQQELHARLATRFTPSAIDEPSPDGEPNYTVDTLVRLRDEMGNMNPGATLFNLVGADSFLLLPKWREPERLLALAEWIVVSRPGYPLNGLADMDLTAAQRARVHLIETASYDISSTWLRERLAAGDSARDLLPDAVARYIREHNLYRSE